MGRYRDFVSALTWHGNEYLRIANEKSIPYEDKAISSIEWQIIEYLIEHPDSTSNMAQIAQSLGLSTSTFSKLVAGLVKTGLVEKYQRVGNKKDVIIRSSPEGKRMYEENARKVMYPLFKESFDLLSDLSDEQLNHVAASIHALRYLKEVETHSKDSIDEKDLIRLE